MKIAITGGTGFVGRNVCRAVTDAGHEAVLLARGVDHANPGVCTWPRTVFARVGLDDPAELAAAMAGCESVVHCAGINREAGKQTFRRVHVDGTQNVIEASRRAAVRRVVLISFLRARPRCASGYHESKWEAEELVRRSGLAYTVLKCGVIYGQGDHMLNHLSHAFYTFPVFGFVGFRDQLIRPNAVEDVARIVTACAADEALTGRTVAVLGPEELSLREAVRRVAGVVGVRPLMFPMPVWFHYGLGWCLERIMTVPMVSVAQVRMLTEGLAGAAQPCEPVPSELAPRIRFTVDQIRRGLPPPGPFGWRDLRWKAAASRPRKSVVFFELP